MTFIRFADLPETAKGKDTACKVQRPTGGANNCESARGRLCRPLRCGFRGGQRRVANAGSLATCPFEQGVATTRYDGGLTFLQKAITAGG